MEGITTVMKILVVDDVPSVALSLENNLQDQGYEVVTSHSYIDSMRYLNTYFDVLIADLVLLGEVETGLHVARLYKAKFPKIKIILTTAHSELPSSINIDIDILSIMEKPINFGDLVDVLEGNSIITPKFKERPMHLECKDKFLQLNQKVDRIDKKLNNIGFIFNSGELT